MGGGGASRPRYIGSMSTYIKEVYKSANKKKYITKGGGRYYIKQKFLETEKWKFFLIKGGRGASRPVYIGSSST